MATRSSVATFEFVQAIATISTLFNNNVQELMSVANHFGDSGTVPGQNINAMVKRVRLTGIVFDWDLVMNQFPIEGVHAFARCFCYLATDRLGTTLVPGGALWDPTITEHPIRSAGSADAGSVETFRPLRILWRKSFLLPIGDANSAAENARVTVNTQVKKKLNMWVDDTTGLYLGFGVVQTTGSAVNFTAFAAGTLYYRTLL